MRHVVFALFAAASIVPSASLAQTSPGMKALEDVLAKRRSDKPPEATLGELAACATAADEPVCLLKLAARSEVVKPYDQNIAIAYAPKVLALVGDTRQQAGLSDMTEASDRGAIAALLADKRGEPPAAALSKIGEAIEAHDRAHPPRDARAAAGRGKYVTYRRIQAYRTLWAAAHGDSPLPAAHRPSPALVSAVLDAWERDLPGLDEVEAKPLVEARMALGDRAGARRVATALAPKADDEVQALLAAGLIDEAATAARRPRVSAMGSDEHGAKLDAMGEGGDAIAVMRAAVKAGRKDIAARVARRIFDGLQTDPAASTRDPFAATTFASAAEALAVSVDRAEARRRIGELEKTGRRDHGPVSAGLSAAAVRGWRKLGETARADAIAAAWRLDPPRQMPFCAGAPGCPEITVHPAFASAMLLTSGSPREAMQTVQGLEAVDAEFEDDIRAGRTDRLEVQLARAASADQLQRKLRSCVEGGAGNYRFSVARLCASRLSPDDPATADNLLYAANAAAGQGDAGAARAFMDLAYRAAAAAPGQSLPRISVLANVAIVQLRAQGRL